MVFLKPEITFLRHLVSYDAFCMKPAETIVTREFPPPKDINGVTCFNGCETIIGDSTRKLAPRHWRCLLSAKDVLNCVGHRKCVF